CNHFKNALQWNLLVLFTCLFAAKPISLVERCWCRSTLNTVPQRSIKELKFLHTPNCPFQVIAKLKNNREVCINPETKWLQQYLKNAINKVKKNRRRNKKN
uniref:Stromal cell-derived factor 1 n=1 Tax=Takifugu rubripes TaxID=31033 RepID=A0A674MV85_TAKRU